MIGCVGEDSFGGFLIEKLIGNGVGVAGVQKVPGKGTGTAVVVVEEERGENRILVSAGANARVSPAMSESMMLQGETRPDMVVLQLEIPLDTVIYVLRAAKKSGVPVVLNPAPAPAERGLPEDVYVGLEHLIMNEMEAAMLGGGVGGGGGGGGVEAGGLDGDTLQLLCERFHGKGVRHVIITLGANGVYYSTSSHGGKEGGGNNRHVAAVKVANVVDTTAAGDTFVGAYAVAIVNGVDVGRAVEWANQAAARTVEREGAQEAIPWLDEVDALPT
ncbi:MAG: hypothetical protein Q9223_005238 [Gallowayella weberi]